MSGDDLSAAYASGDVFMMPSESETLGFVALEAMASGLPVVAVAAGGLTDILTNPGVTGCLLLPCSTPSLASPAHCFPKPRRQLPQVHLISVTSLCCFQLLYTWAVSGLAGGACHSIRPLCTQELLECFVWNYAGFLYPPSDYTQAAKITAELLASPARRQAVGAAARQEVERWGWMPATQLLREQQYQQAIRRNRGRRW